jgi:LysM repeat protein
MRDDQYPSTPNRPRPAPFDRASRATTDEADGPGARDLTAEFWGTTDEWAPTAVRPERRIGRRRDATNQIPAVQALRDGIAAFRPQRRAGAVDVDRTREHGIVRPGAQPDETYPRPRRSAHPGDARVPVASNEATLGELASGQVDFDGPIPHRPTWARRDDTFDAAAAPLARARRTTAPIAPVSFDEIDEYDYDEYDDGHGDIGPHGEPDVWTDLEVAPVARRWAERVGVGAVDPLIARIGVLLLVTALLVPLALSLRGGDESQLEFGAPGVVVAAGATTGVATQPTPTPTPAATPTAVVTAAAAVEPPTLDDVATAETLAASQRAADTAADLDVVVTQDESDESADDAADDTTASTIGGYAQSATVDEPAARAQCGADYTIVAGDSWYRLADAAGVEPGELLAVNQATTDTVLLPGDVICLPEGAQTPAPPPTAAPTTAGSTSTAAPSTTTASTTTAPSTTAAPTTTAAPGPAVVIVSVDEAKQIIRDVWPDDLEERALEIAYRESNWRADADNGWCCVGLFQIYWTVHQGWLDDYGITTREHLKDARKNAEAAYALYQRAGGWSPWSTA